MRLKSIRQRLTGSEGQAIVEFALVMPLLLLLIIGVVEFGRAWNIKQVITDAAREGARIAVIYEPTMTFDSVYNTTARAMARGGVAPPPANGATITITGWNDGGGQPATVAIAVPYNFVFFGPMYNLFFNQSKTHTMTLNTSFTMRNE